MPPPDKRLGARIPIRPLTTLQKVIISAEFDIFIIGVILVNCIFMASESPVLVTPAQYIIIANYFFNVVFILELVLQITAFGVLPYFADYWHYLDAIVVATSLLDIVLAILKLLSGLINVSFNINVKVLRVLRVIRFFRVLRPLRALRYFKGILIFIESLAMSVDILLITTGMFMTAMIAIAFLTNSFIGDLLNQRCMPPMTTINNVTDLFLSSPARSDPNYQAYGVNYYFSSYNLDYCKNVNACTPGYECNRISSDGYFGVPGDYSTPYNAFKTNLSFVTLRGWPLIFTAISKGYGIIYAFLVLFATALICPLFILNMFPAIFIISLKRCEDTQKRLDWLSQFPGDKETVTELELFIWANNNQGIFFRLDNAPSVNIISQMINGCFSCCQFIGIFSRTPLVVPQIEADRGKTDDTATADDGEEGEDDVFLGAEEDDPDFGKGKLCVPKCRSIAALRSIFTADTSPFSQFINVVIILNILSLAADAASTPATGRKVVLYLNYAFISIFMAEVVAKILLLGPCLYLDSPFNLLDFTLVVLSIPTFFDSSFQVLGALRILRLARLARTGQITRLYNQLNTAGQQKAPKTPIDLGRLSAMIFDLLTPMINNTILIVVLMYIYALIGMQFFASANASPYLLPPFSLTLVNPLVPVNGTTAVQISGIFSAGQYLPRMNFNCFGNAFVTVFNIGLLNGWYLFMVNTIRRQEQEGPLWYFFSYVYLIVFLLGSTLIASVVSVLDGHAKAMIRDIAGSNKSVVNRYVILSRRERLRVWFKRLKKNTIETGEGSTQKEGNTKLKREAVSDWAEGPPAEPLFTRLLRERSDHSFYLFSRTGAIRRVLKFVVESVVFQFLITFAVLISVIGVVSEQSSLMGPADEPLFIVVVFLCEMGLLWLVYGVMGSAPDAYFNQPLYLVDFFVNIAMMYAFFTDVTVLNQLRLFRMLKLPNLMLYLTDSNTLRLFFVMLFEAIPSLGSVLSMTLGITFLAAVVGVQLYTGLFNHCSDNAYPGARYRYAKDPVYYPEGCSGVSYPNEVNAMNSGLHWQARLDNFDSIFTSCKSTLRVIMSNEWQGILFSALDTVGLDYQPKTNYSRSKGGGSFIFFFVLSLFGITIGALYVSIFYYHFVITCTLTGRKSMIGRQDAMWALYEEKLILVKQSIPLAGSSWAALAKFYRRLDVKLIIIMYCVVPIVLMIGFYGNTSYTDEDFMFYDAIFSILYVAEYCFRGCSDITFPKQLSLKKKIVSLYKSTNKQEAGIVLFLIFSVFVNVRTLSGGNQVIFTPGSSRDIEFVFACGILRVYRLAILFPNALRVIGVMQTSLGGFISLGVYALIVIMIFGLLGYDVMLHLTPSYGSPFLDNALNFKSLPDSWLTLLAIGTGNYYSEVLNNLKQETKGNLGMMIFIEIYFLCFYLLFFLTLKSFAIQIIIRYESTFGSSLGIAGEQISAFQHAWRMASLHDKVKYDKLALFISEYLPPPLGLAGTNPKYLELSRFVKKLLLCMPADVKRCNDLVKSVKCTRVLYPPETVPSDIRCIDETWDPTKHRFSFRQVIVAAHKRALFDFVLADEAANSAARVVHQSRLDNVVVFLSRLTLTRYENHHLPFKAMLLMQRLRPDMYKNYFLSILRAQLHTLRLKIHVFGFSAFDAFITSTLRGAVHVEVKAAHLQLEVKKSLDYAAHHSRKSLAVYDKAKKYLSGTKALGKLVDELYDSKMQNMWDINSLDVYTSAREKRSVTAVAIDYSGKIFVALNSGLLKIYKTRETADLPMRLVQKVSMKAHIRSMVVSQDAKKVFLACGNDVKVLALSSNRKRLNYKELLSFSGHSAAVNTVQPFDRFILSGGQDCMVHLWRLNSRDPANAYDAGSAVFCMTVMPVSESNVAVDEMTLTDILIAGTQRGRILVLPLPLAGSSTESAYWEGFFVEGGECGVSSVQVAWGYVYAGFTDGRVKTWAVEMRKSVNSNVSPIRNVVFLPVQSVQVHAGPVTCLAFTGGSLFSASYDFSILPWTAPDRLNAKTVANFTQSYREGMIHHSNSILTISSNKTMMVTGDEGGRVVVTYAKKVREDFMASGGDSHNLKSRPQFSFSFIEYDFKKCFVDNNGGVIEEEVMLNVLNNSGGPATIRCLLKRHPCFRVESCENENRCNGSEIVSLISTGSSNFKIATRFDNHHSVQYRIVFHPLETRVVHLPIQFLINEKDMVTIQVKGSGCKSKIFVTQNIKLYEMGTVPIGHYGVERISIENREERPILVNCLAECEDKIENSNYEISTVKHNLAERYFSVIPRCFSIPPFEHVELLVRFVPPVKVDVFKIPIRAIYGGGEGTLAEMRVRSADPPSSVVRETMASPPSKRGNSGPSAQFLFKKDSAALPNDKDVLDSVSTEDDMESHAGLFDEAKAMQYLYRGLRTLSPSESPCPSDLLVSLLRDIGWKVALEGPLAMLMHPETGVFIEIPNCHTASSTSTGKPEPLPTMSEFEVDFRCAEPSNYEVWYGNRLVRSGQGESDSLNIISIDCTELYLETDKFGSAVPTDIPESDNDGYEDDGENEKSFTTGTQMLVLMVFRRDATETAVAEKKKKEKRKPLFTNTGTQSDGRVMLYATYIKIYKGFRLGFLQSEGDDSDDDQGTLELEERVLIAGITRVTSYMENDLGTLTEFFEKDAESPLTPQGLALHKKPLFLGGEPHEDLFARSMLCINTKASVPSSDYIPEKNKVSSSKYTEPTFEEGPTHIRVVDRAIAIDLQDPLESTVAEHRTDNTEVGKTTSGIKEIFLERPVLTGDVNIKRCSRMLTIQLLKKPSHEAADDMQKDEMLLSGEVAGHAALHMRSEAQLMPFTVTRSALPHLVHSHSHGVYLRLPCPVEEPPARLKHLYALMNQAAVDEGDSDVRISSLFGGQWYFLVDRNSLKLVSSAVMDPVETVDITLLTRGFVAEFRGGEERCMAAVDGRHVTVEEVIELPKSMRNVLSKLQLANNRGLSSQFTDAPLFLSGKWGELVKYSLHRKVVNAMLLLVERARVIAAGRSAHEAAVINKEYEAYAATQPVGSSTRHKGADALAKKEAESKVKKIMDATLPTIDLTYKDVYSDMTRITNELVAADAAAAAAAAVDSKKEAPSKQETLRQAAVSSFMNVKNLTLFLLRETLPGFDEPLSDIQVGVVLESMERSPNSAVKVEQFAHWYKSDDEKELKEELKPKRIFACLLEEVTQSDEPSVAADYDDRVLNGVAAKRAIKDMHITSDDTKNWLESQSELISSSSFNEGMDYYPESKTGDQDNVPPTTTTARASGLKKFFRRPILPVINLNPRERLSSLTGFIKNINNRRKSHVEASVPTGRNVERLDSQVNDLGLTDSVQGQGQGGGGERGGSLGAAQRSGRDTPSGAQGDLPRTVQSLAALRERSEVDDDDAEEYVNSDIGSEVVGREVDEESSDGWEEASDSSMSDESDREDDEEGGGEGEGGDQVVDEWEQYHDRGDGGGGTVGYVNGVQRRMPEASL